MFSVLNQNGVFPVPISDSYVLDLSVGQPDDDFKCIVEIELLQLTIGNPVIYS